MGELVVTSVNEGYPELKNKKKTSRRGRKIAAVKVAKLLCPAYSNFHLLLHIKKQMAGQKFNEDEEVKNEVTAWLRAQVAELCDNYQYIDICIERTPKRMNSRRTEKR